MKEEALHFIFKLVITFCLSCNKISILIQIRKICLQRFHDIIVQFTVSSAVLSRP